MFAYVPPTNEFWRGHGDWSLQAMLSLCHWLADDDDDDDDDDYDDDDDDDVDVCMLISEVQQLNIVYLSVQRSWQIFIVFNYSFSFDGGVHVDKRNNF